jgi:hypothetical protein
MVPTFKEKFKSIKYTVKVTAGLFVFTFAFMIIGNHLTSGRIRSLVFTNLVLVLVLACCASAIWLAFLLVKYLTERI